MNIKFTPSKILDAVTIIGSVALLAERCGVSPQAVYKWIKRGKLPINKCVAVETALGGKMTRFDFMPTELIPTERLKQS